MTGKSWYASKTIWVNLLGLVFSLLVSFGFSLSAEQIAGASTGMLAVLNIGLRMATGEPINWET